MAKVLAVASPGWARWRLAGAGLLALTLATSAPADGERGRIEGRLVRPDGRGLGGVKVVLTELAIERFTDAGGRYAFSRVPAGTYTLTFALGERFSREDRVVVEAGGGEAAPPTTVSTTVDWDPAFVETITVRSASRRAERLVEAPAAVTVLEAADVERRSGSDQLPRLLAATPGSELTQSGLYDLNLNTRGFNSTTNRRILVLIDGRDPSLPVFSGSQEWAALSFSLDELENVEMVRGPGAALYGAGAFNGVLDLTTKPPRASLGGRLRLTAGELDTRRLDIRHAATLGADTFLKVLGSVQESEDFAVSRTSGFEYAAGLLPPETVPLPSDRIETSSGTLRLDRYLGPRLLTLEAGSARSQGVTTLTGIGRTQRGDSRRPWARALISAPRWQAQVSYTGKDSNEISLGSGDPVVLDSYRLAFETQANLDFAGGRGALTGGATYVEQRADSASSGGRQTVFAGVVRSDHRAVFGQVGYELSDRLRGVLSLRWDESDLHDARVSPRAALVYGASPRHTLRLSFGDGFLSPALAEKFLDIPVGLPPLDLSPVEDALGPLLGGVRLGLESVPLLAIGREDLDVEEITSLEVGYTGILRDHLLLNVNVYANDLRDFTTNLLPVVGTSLGQLGDPPPYAPPAELPPAARDAVLEALRASLPGLLLSQRADGTPFIPLLSFGQFGQIDSRGAELALSWRRSGWHLDFSWSHFEFEVGREVLENPQSANRPEDLLSAGVSRIDDDYTLVLEVRWSDDFVYRSGIFGGPVPSYTVGDLHGQYFLTPRWTAGVDVANLFDEIHYEAFGGDLLGRRGLFYVSYRWQ